jgi:hypothetical protein
MRDNGTAGLTAAIEDCANPRRKFGRRVRLADQIDAGIKPAVMDA